MQNEAIEPGIKEGINPVAKQIFKPSSWLTKIDYINHLVLFNNVLIAVLAEQGAGKSTFAEVLQSSLDSQIKTHVVKAVAPFSQSDFLTQLDTVFHFRMDTEISLAKLVNQINERKAQVLIIIDDAQHLPDSFLQEVLFELKHQGESGFFHLCLVSGFSLVASLNKLEPNLIHTLEPGALTEVETKTYLLNSLPPLKALDKTMTEKRLEQFYQMTGGSIARINNQMKDYFCPEPIKSADRRKSFVRNLGFLATAGIALMASSYIWQNQFLPSSSTNALEELEYKISEPVAEISQPLPSLVPLIPVLEKEPVLVSQLPDINHELASRPSQIPGWLASAVKQQVQPSPKRIVDVVLEEESDDSLVVRDRVVVIPKTLHATEKAAKPAPKVAAAAQTIPSKFGQARMATGRQFTIQVLASRKRDDVMRFVNNHKMVANTKIRLTKRDGLDWYVLTIGEFGQMDQAQAAVRGLPAELAKFNPWIRPVAQLKAVG
ncbi:DamX-related protein [Legionella nautarum]|uniref:DamX-related protein n=1 Tax=Legionella nautarum TaxID=45070 RepID=A0A0W0X442_9GAMM|nr:AAA family ATPase [Legionella nautarum]KTD39319.1 DamX-related protein [Legionella nautarum]